MVDLKIKLNEVYSVYLSIVGIFLFSMFLRLEPLIYSPMWGSDYGEYYYLSSYLISNHHLLLNNYGGWGFGYPYFPGMFVIVSSFTLISGVPLFYSINFLIPVIDAFAAVTVYLIADRITSSFIASISSALFITVVMPIVFVTSHSIPSTVGDFLFITSLYLFIKVDDDERYWLILFIVSICLIPTDNLSTYMFFISALGALFISELLIAKKDKKFSWGKVAFLEIYLLFMTTYWFTYAYKFEKKIVGTAFSIHIGSYMLFIIAGISILAVPLIVKIRREYLPFKMRLHPLSIKKITVRSLSLFVLVITGVYLLTLVDIPGTTMEVPIASFIFFIPMIIILSMTLVGSRVMDFFKYGNYTLGWLTAIVGSAFIGAVTDSPVLMPYRHIEYLLYPAGIFFGASVWIIYYNISFSKKLKLIFVFFIAALLISNAVIDYPPQKIMNGFNESYSYSDFGAISWMHYNIHGDTIATDHRLSSVIWGFTGNYATWGDTKALFFSENTTAILQSLNNTGAPFVKRHVELVVIDQYIINGVDINPNAPALPLKNPKKFMQSPFVLLYSCNGASIYAVNYQSYMA